MGFWLIQLSPTVALPSRSTLRPTTRTLRPQMLSSIPSSTRRSNQGLKRETSHNQRVRQSLNGSFDLHVLACKLPCCCLLRVAVMVTDARRRRRLQTRRFLPYKMIRSFYHSRSRFLSADNYTGPSGTVKLAKKEAAAKPAAAKEKKPAAKVHVSLALSQGIFANSSQKATKAAKPAGTKTAGRPKKTDAKPTTKAAPKKASTTKAKAAPKAKAAKANTSTKRVKKTPAMVRHDLSATARYNR